MGKANFSDDFKRDVARQLTERGYPVRGGQAAEEGTGSRHRGARHPKKVAA